LAIIATVLKYGHYYTKSLLLVWYIVMVFSININGFGLRCLFSCPTYIFYKTRHLRADK